MKTEYVSTDQLREGDTILNYGMVILLGPIHISLRHSDKGMPVFYSYGQIQNREEVEFDQLLRGLLTKSYWDEAKGWVSAYSGVWTVQGNHLAHWHRVIGE